MNSGFRRRGTTLVTALALTCAGLAAAQGLDGDTSQAPAAAPAPASGPVESPAALAALAAARAGDGARVRSIYEQAADPLTRKIALWAMADATPEVMTWDQARQARAELALWPRPSRRQVAAERLIDRSGLPTESIVAWFGKDEPVTPQGAMALAGALRAQARTDAAARVISRAWRTLIFDQTVQADMLARYGDLLTVEDHAAREDLLLYGVQGPAAQDLLRLLTPQQQALAQARMAVRRGDPAAQAMIETLPAADQTSPGLAFERVIALRDRGDIPGALALTPYLPTTLPDEHAAERLWNRGTLMVQAMQSGDTATAYQVAARSGLTTGPDAANAQFYAGWIALARLKDARLADAHFARLEQAGPSPLTQSRALYWRGRAAEVEGDEVAAQIFYEQASRYYTTFYGQLAASKGGKTELTLGRDPTITPQDQARFEALDAVRATRLFARMGASEAVRTFVAGLSESLTSAQDEAMLVDLARGLGEQELSMRVVRNAAKRGFILPERGYPVRNSPSGPEAAEAPLVLSVTRQESGFDPNARSGVGARGLMQLMPATALNVARRSGLGRGSLADPDFNMRVGATYLGQLVNQFSGSYVMAAAAYNAGPSRPIQWVGVCGDPRGSSTDPLDFIECIPFSETRDYVMRVMESTQIYRARLNGGVAPNSLASDLKRGAYGYRPLTFDPAPSPLASGVLVASPAPADPGGH